MLSLFATPFHLYVVQEFIAPGPNDADVATVYEGIAL